MARVARRPPVKGGAAAGPGLAARYPEWFMLGVVTLTAGWQDLADKLFDDLAATLSPEDRERFSVAAVRERAGRLSVETYTTVEAALPLIEAAVQDSTRICQSCGAPGRRKSFEGWSATLCTPCRRRLGAMRIGGG